MIGPVPWPPVTVTTARLVLRQLEAQDRAAIIELFASPEVGTYVGGSQPRDHLEWSVRPGLAPRGLGDREQARVAPGSVRSLAPVVAARLRRPAVVGMLALLGVLVVRAACRRAG